MFAWEETVGGTPFGRYRLVDRLGRGGMGEVWRAYDTVTDRVVAIKVLPASLSENTDFQRRFRREAHAAARLDTPHVVPIHDYGEIDGRLFVSMRLIKGRDLGAVLAQGPLDPARAVRIIDQVAKALHAAHKVRLIHRDIKPSNILLDDDDFAYLIDFGIARIADETRLTQSGHMIGTFQYIAPERLDSQIEEDARSDIYSLACVLYEALTGEPPFAGTTTAHLIAAHLNTPPPRASTTLPSLPPQVDEVIAIGMAKDRNQRYASTIELADAAHVAITEPIRRPIATPPPLPATVEASLPLTQGAGNRGTVKASPTTNSFTPSFGRPQITIPPANQTVVVSPSRPKVRETGVNDLQSPYAPTRAVWAGIAVGITLIAIVVIVVLAFINVNHGPASSSSTALSKTALSNSAVVPRSSGPGAAALPPFNPPAALGENCTYSATADAAVKQVSPPHSGKIPTEPTEVSATMVTNHGSIGIQLNNGMAPCTVNNFASLAQKGFFDNTTCHRLTSAPTLAVLQCGDPTGQGTGGPGYQFANEYPTNQYASNDPALQRPVVYPRGTVAMANAGPGTNGSQFFLVYKDSELPPEYTVFGSINKTGLATLDKIAALGVAGGGDDGMPASPVTIKSIRLD